MRFLFIEGLCLQLVATSVIELIHLYLNATVGNYSTQCPQGTNWENKQSSLMSINNKTKGYIMVNGSVYPIKQDKVFINGSLQTYTTQKHMCYHQLDIVAEGKTRIAINFKYIGGIYSDQHQEQGTLLCIHAIGNNHTFITSIFSTTSVEQVVCNSGGLSGTILTNGSVMLQVAVFEIGQEIITSFKEDLVSKLRSLQLIRTWNCGGDCPMCYDLDDNIVCLDCDIMNGVNTIENVTLLQQRNTQRNDISLKSSASSIKQTPPNIDFRPDYCSLKNVSILCSPDCKDCNNGTCTQCLDKNNIVLDKNNKICAIIIPLYKNKVITLSWDSPKNISNLKQVLPQCCKFYLNGTEKSELQVPQLQDKNILQIYVPPELNESNVNFFVCNFTQTYFFGQINFTLPITQPQVSTSTLSTPNNESLTSQSEKNQVTSDVIQTNSSESTKIESLETRQPQSTQETSDLNNPVNTSQSQPIQEISDPNKTVNNTIQESSRSSSQVVQQLSEMQLMEIRSKKINEIYQKHLLSGKSEVKITQKLNNSYSLLVDENALSGKIASVIRLLNFWTFLTNVPYWLSYQQLLPWPQIYHLQQVEKMLTLWVFTGSYLTLFPSESENPSLLFIDFDLKTQDDDMAINLRSLGFSSYFLFSNLAQILSIIVMLILQLIVKLVAKKPSYTPLDNDTNLQELLASQTLNSTQKVFIQKVFAMELQTTRRFVNTLFLRVLDKSFHLSLFNMILMHQYPPFYISSSGLAYVSFIIGYAIWFIILGKFYLEIKEIRQAMSTYELVRIGPDRLFTVYCTKLQIAYPYSLGDIHLNDSSNGYYHYISFLKKLLMALVVIFGSKSYYMESTLLIINILFISFLLNRKPYLLKLKQIFHIIINVIMVGILTIKCFTQFELILFLDYYPQDDERYEKIVAIGWTLVILELFMVLISVAYTLIYYTLQLIDCAKKRRQSR